MKRRVKKVPPAAVVEEIEIDILVRSELRVTSEVGEVLNKKVREGLKELFPGAHRVRALWVHEDIPRAVDRRDAVNLIISAEDCEDSREFVKMAIEISKKMKGEHV